MRIYLDDEVRWKMLLKPYTSFRPRTTVLSTLTRRPFKSASHTRALNRKTCIFQTSFMRVVKIFEVREFVLRYSRSRDFVRCFGLKTARMPPEGVTLMKNNMTHPFRVGFRIKSRFWRLKKKKLEKLFAFFHLISV